MKIYKLLIIGVILFIAALSPGLARGETPAQPTTRYQTKFDIVNPPAQFDELVIFAEVAPGSATPPHIHGGNQYVTVLEGELTRRVFSPVASEKQYKAGDTWSEITGEVHQVLNLGTVRAHTIGTFLLPKGAPLTTIQQTGATSQQLPGPKTLSQAKLTVDQPPAQYGLNHLVQDFAPNAATPSESYGGQALSLVMEGALTVRVNGTDKIYKAGESWTNDAGQVFVVTNASGANASVAVSILLPKGAALTNAQTAAPATLPTTGADLASAYWVWIAVIGGTVLVATGWLLRNRIARVR